MQRLSGRVDIATQTALILLFDVNAGKTDFSSACFRLLWEREKDISTDRLKRRMR